MRFRRKRKWDDGCWLDVGCLSDPFPLIHLSANGVARGGGIRGIPLPVEEKSKKMASKMAKNGVNFKFFSPAAPIGTVGDLFT